MSACIFLVLDGFYENAFVLDDGLWDRLEAEIGPVAISIPARDMVMIAPKNDPNLVELMTDIRDMALADHPYPLSEHLFARNNGAWSQLPD